MSKVNLSNIELADLLKSGKFIKQQVADFMDSGASVTKPSYSDILGEIFRRLEAVGVLALRTGDYCYRRSTAASEKEDGRPVWQLTQVNDTYVDLISENPDDYRLYNPDQHDLFTGASHGNGGVEGKGDLLTTDKMDEVCGNQ